MHRAGLRGPGPNAGTDGTAGPPAASAYDPPLAFSGDGVTIAAADDGWSSEQDHDVHAEIAYYTAGGRLAAAGLDHSVEGDGVPAGIRANEVLLAAADERHVVVTQHLPELSEWVKNTTTHLGPGLMAVPAVPGGGDYTVLVVDAAILDARTGEDLVLDATIAPTRVVAGYGIAVGYGIVAYPATG